MHTHTHTHTHTLACRVCLNFCEALVTPTDADVATFQDVGVVVLRGLLSASEIDILRDAIDWNLDNPGPLAGLWVLGECAIGCFLLLVVFSCVHIDFDHPYYLFVLFLIASPTLHTFGLQLFHMCARFRYDCARVCVVCDCVCIYGYVHVCMYVCICACM